MGHRTPQPGVPVPVPAGALELQLGGQDRPAQVRWGGGLWEEEGWWGRGKKASGRRRLGEAAFSSPWHLCPDHTALATLAQFQMRRVPGVNEGQLKTRCGPASGLGEERSKKDPREEKTAHSWRSPQMRWGSPSYLPLLLHTHTQNKTHEDMRTGGSWFQARRYEPGHAFVRSFICPFVHHIH